MDDSRIKTAAELISSIVSPQVAEAAGTWAKFVGAWPRLAGPRVAAHSRITDVVNQFVVVTADHPGWIQLLQFRQSVLLESLQKEFPALHIRGIQFRLSGSETQRGSTPEPVSPNLKTDEAAEKPGPSPERVVRFDPDGIKDEVLRNALIGLRDAMEGRGTSNGSVDQ